MNKKNAWLLYLSIVLFGGIGIYCTFFSSNTKKYDSQTEAYRIEENESRDSEGTTTYTPTYYFKVNGKEYKCESNTGSSARPKDSKNKVYYDSKNPNHCLTEYGASSGRLAGIVCLIVTGIILFFVIKKPALETNAGEVNNPLPEMNSEEERKMEENMRKAEEVIDMVQLIVKRVILGIIIFVLLLIILFDSLLFKQTMVSRNYPEVVASYVEEKEVQESTVFRDYTYSFEDKKGKQQEITVSYSNDEVPPRELKIKYNEKDPQDYYLESSVLNRSGMIWYFVKIVIFVLLILLFFNKKLLSKIKFSVGR